MKYVTEVTENYRVDTEAEATQLIEKAKHNKIYALKKYSSVHKQRFSRGELLDDYYKVTLVKTFNDEKDATNEIEITYTTAFNVPVINLMEEDRENGEI